MTLQAVASLWFALPPPAPSGGDTPRKFGVGFFAQVQNQPPQTSSRREQLLRFSLFMAALAAGPSLAWAVYRGGRKRCKASRTLTPTKQIGFAKQLQGIFTVSLTK